MKTVVLDANELTKDFMLAGLKYQLFEHMFHVTWVTVYVPAVVVEELVANYARAVMKAGSGLVRTNRERASLGLAPVSSPPAPFDYRTYIQERFDDHLGFSVLPWPSTRHEDLVARAVNRTPPFDDRGGGYRDALVWADVVELARSGHDIALVSMDKAFMGDNGALALELQAEVEPLKGSVKLVRDFNRWLLEALPWKSVQDLKSAVGHSRISEFYDFYLKSDFQDDLEPTVEDLSFSLSPYAFVIEQIDWDGGFQPIEGTADEAGLELIEFELGQDVTFTATFPEGIDVEPGWRVSEPNYFRRVEVEGSIAMILRVAVLFGGDERFSIEELSWRRADGTGSGASVYRPELDVNQTSLFEVGP